MVLNKINVAVKCRPVSATECLEETIDFFQSDQNLVTTPRNKFNFKYIFTPKNTCREVFEMIIRPMLDKTVLGYNGTVLAYGQTGSGKTYTLGTEVIAHQEGITQMVLNYLFKITGLRLKVSVLEIYLRDCYDLLHATPHKINIQGLKPVSVALQDADNLETAMDLLMSAVKNRRVGATALNKSSSRSHMIITLYIENSYSISKFNIVDLAGSEKIQSSSGNLRNEGVAINEALLSLGRVVNCLAQAKSHIPFRDSPLTHLLEDSLNRDNYITLIGCINSIKKNVEETEKTLEFAVKFAGISASKVMIGTPYKTPSRFVNNTFTNGSDFFKKPLTPLNKTIATTPVNWGLKKQEQPQAKISRRDTLNNSNGSLNLNLSNVSTSTAVLENSPLQDQMDSFSNTTSDALKAVTLTPANLHYYIKETVGQAIKDTIKKEISQLFKREVNVFHQQKSSQAFSNRLLDLADTYGSLSESSPADDSSDSDLQTTVLGVEEMFDSEAPTSNGQYEPLSKKPKNSSPNTKEISSSNLNGSLYDFDSPNIQSEKVLVQKMNPETSSVVFRQAALRRSTRLSTMNSPFGGTPDGKDIDSNLNSTNSEVFIKPQFRMRCLRRSVLRRAFEDSESEETSKGDSTDSSSAPDTEVFKKPQMRRYVRRSVLRTAEESRSDEHTDRKDSGVHSDSGAPMRASRRSIRLSIKRPVENERGSPVNKVGRRSLRVSLLNTDNHDGKKPTKPRGKKTTNSESSTGNISHEKRILKILQEGSTKDLLQLATVGPKTAALIINDRLLHGPLKTVKDYAKIRGVTPNQGQKFLWYNSLI